MPASLPLRPVAVVLLALLLGACHAAPPPAPAARVVVVEHPQPVSDGGAEVYPGPVRARVEADLSFRIPGKITARKVDAGSLVQAGQTLATLDPQDSKLNVDAARTAVAAAAADLKLAQAESRRNRDLLGRGFVSQAAVDLTDNQAALAQAKLDQAQAQLNLVQNQSGYTSLRADEDGVITSVLAEAGQVVSAGQPVFRFAAAHGREVVIAVPEGRYEAVRNAPALRVTLWAEPGKVYRGRVREISPQADPALRTHQARISIVDADAAVKLGMSAAVALGNGGSGALFRLPASALAGDKDHPAVWIVTGNAVHATPVTVVRYESDAVYVSGALKPEDDVVSAGVHLLAENQAVRPTPRHTASRS